MLRCFGFLPLKLNGERLASTPRGRGFDSLQGRLSSGFNMSRTDPKELFAKLARAHELVQVGGYYRHRNGTLYWVRDITLREEDVEPAVIYQEVNGPPIPWDRKVSVFIERFHRVELPPPPVV